MPQTYNLSSRPHRRIYPTWFSFLMDCRLQYPFTKCESLYIGRFSIFLQYRNFSLIISHEQMCVWMYECYVVHACDVTGVVSCWLYSCIRKKWSVEKFMHYFWISCEYLFFFWLHSFIPGVPWNYWFVFFVFFPLWGIDVVWLGSILVCSIISHVKMLHWHICRKEVAFKNNRIV